MTAITVSDIENRVPVTPPAYGRRTTTYAILRELGTGQSVVIETENGHSLRAAVAYVRKRYRLGMTVRKLGSTAPGLESYRVWRVK